MALRRPGFHRLLILKHIYPALKANVPPLERAQSPIPQAAVRRKGTAALNLSICLQMQSKSAVRSTLKNITAGFFPMAAGRSSSSISA